MQRLGSVVLLAGVFAAGFVVRGVLPGAPVLQAQTAAKVYELRTYVVPEDKLAPLNARFRNHTMRIFQRHGISSVAYFTPQDPAKAKTTLVYMIAHPSREAADKNWEAFRADAEWQKVAAESGVPRPTITSEFLVATDYSPMK
jgi:hypothetical protein